MKWIEMIQLRAVNSNRSLLESELHNLMDEAGNDGNGQVVMVYGHAVIDADYCIQIVHDSGKAENPGSSLGMQLVTALKEFGMVRHTVWVEMTHK